VTVAAVTDWSAIRIGRSAWAALTDEQRYLLRFNSVVSDADAALDAETYRTFAF
jgi:hypothetical protein